jgi:hypothetical protein
MKIITSIKGTAFTPEIVLKSDGTISISGNSKMDDPSSFYKPILNWVWLYKTNCLVFDLKLVEINSESTRQILEMFELAKANPWVDSLNVFWEYNAMCDDEYNPEKEFDYVLGPSAGLIKDSIYD